MCFHVPDADDDDDVEDETVTCPSLTSFPLAIVTSLLRAMRLGSSEARQRFPRVLNIVAAHSDAMSAFIKQCEDVPIWMFLAWLPQLTALLDKPESMAVQSILERVAQTYPNALFYAFTLSSESYKFDTSSAVGKQAEAVCKKIVQLLSKNKLMTAFVRALEQFGQPEAIFSDFSKDFTFRKLLEAPEVNKEKILKMYRDMYDELLNTQLSESNEDLFSTSTVPSTIGKTCTIMYSIHVMMYM